MQFTYYLLFLYCIFLHLSQFLSFAKVFIGNIFNCLLKQSLLLPLNEDGNDLWNSINCLINSWLRPYYSVYEYGCIRLLIHTWWLTSSINNRYWIRQTQQLSLCLVVCTHCTSQYMRSLLSRQICTDRHLYV